MDELISHPKEESSPRLKASSNAARLRPHGLSGGSSVAMVGGIGAFLVGTVFLSPLVSIGDSAPDLRSRCQSGISRSVSRSLDPGQSQQSLCWLPRHHAVQEELEDILEMPVDAGGAKGAEDRCSRYTEEVCFAG